MGGRGQGIALNTIVLAAIAVLILVLVILFATGTLGKLFTGAKEISEVATPDQVAVFRIGCSQACFQAQQLADTPAEWNASSYCCRTIKTAGSNYTNCWEPPVVSECNKTSAELGITFTAQDYCKCTK